MSQRRGRYRFRSLVFWPERGLICVEDRRDNSFDVIMVREFLYRTKAINDEVKRMTYSSDRLEHQKFVEDAITACKRARQQGSPDDPKAVADIIKQRRKSILYAGGRPSPYSNVTSAKLCPEGAKLPPLFNFDGSVMKF